MHIVVGLGNPGHAYAHSRHNVGFMVIERLAERWHITWQEEKPVRRIGRGRIAQVPVVLIEPLTYMNRSGDALRELDLCATDQLIVLYDDLDLPWGQLRVRPRGRTGGHRGVASLVAAVDRDFTRVRIGIGRPPEGVAAAEYVLMPLAASDRREVAAIVERACDAVECVVTEGVEVAMNRFNGPWMPSIN